MRKCGLLVVFSVGRSDMQELRLDECKAYLRRHNLRLSGNKEECIARIEEHSKLVLYLKAFSIVC